MVTAMLLSAKAARYSKADGVTGGGQGAEVYSMLEDEEKEEVEEVDDNMLNG